MTVGDQTKIVNVDTIQPIAFMMEKSVMAKDGTLGAHTIERPRKGVGWAHKSLRRSVYRCVAKNFIFYQAAPVATLF